MKVNDVEMSMDEISGPAPKTLPLREGALSVSVALFQAFSGTVVNIVTPSVKLAVSLVRALTFEVILGRNVVFFTGCLERFNAADDTCITPNTYLIGQDQTNPSASLRPIMHSHPQFPSLLVKPVTILLKGYVKFFPYPS